MNQVVPLNATARALLWNLSQLVLEHRRLLQLSRRKQPQEEAEEEAYFVEYIPPARDAISLPRNVVYVLVGVVLVIAATYAIVGHLIKDLMHDLADWILGPKPVEDHSEEGRMVVAGERHLRASGKLMERDRLWMEMEMEKDGMLPGFHRGDGLCPPPAPPPPLRSSIPSHPGEKRISTNSVTFTCPATSYATSL